MIRIQLAACVAALFLASTANAGEKKLLHCFAFTSIKEATPAQWDAFFKASDAMPKKIKGVTKVWYGKLQNPLGIYAVTADAEARKKLLAGDKIPAEVQRTPRDWGMCMEMTGLDALKAYDTAPYHKIWTDAYSKVRVDGTTTFNFMGQ